ncbi:gag-pol polyprotein [Lasius niger]|uniref:Gag-pol polyprotein n=1 Tax=Lasius niger TaxID=67767 RepID=A0A0J7NCS3_LASNI|nr:gag-pol polyprotein [Lasius niger]
MDTEKEITLPSQGGRIPQGSAAVAGMVPAAMPSSSDDGLSGANLAGVPATQVTAINLDTMMMTQAPVSTENAMAIPPSFLLLFGNIPEMSNTTVDSIPTQDSESGAASQAPLLPPDKAPTEPMDDIEFAPGIILRPMDAELDTASVTSSSIQILGKRKKDDVGDIKYEDDNDPSPQIRKSSRLSRTTCIVTDDEGSSKRKVPSQKTHKAGPSSKASDTLEIPSQSCSETEGGPSVKRSNRRVKRRKSSKEPTIIDRLHPLPLNIEELHTSPAAHIGASALEWLNDVEIIRAGSSSFQGALSGQMKSRFGILKKILCIMAEKIEKVGDPGYLRRRNAELMAELEVSRRKTALLKKNLSNLQRVVQDLRITIGSRDPNLDVRRAEKATSPITPLPKRNTRSKKRSGSPSDPSEPNSINTIEDTVMKVSPLKGVSTPIPAVERNSVKKNKDIEAEISKQIIELVSKRKEIRSVIREGKEGVSLSPSSSSLVESKKRKIRIIENKQLVPPSNLDKQPAGSASAPKAEEPKEPRKTAANGPKSGVEKSETVKLPKRRRPPRTAAVAIKGITDGFSYSAALRKLRDKISLTTLKIETSKDTAVVTRPVIKREVRIIGLDDTVCREEVADTIAAAGGCASADVKVGTIRMMSNQLYMVWAQCPLEAAIKASKEGKIKISWTIAKIELLKNRQSQCYKRWGLGHLRDKCTSVIDRSRTCFRCGVEGHPAVTCTNPVCCILCKEQNKNPQHRVGSAMCKADLRDPSRRLVDMEVNDG